MATAGTLVNTSVGYASNDTGAVTDFSGTDTLTPSMKIFYDTVLLDQVKTKDVFTQVSKKQRLPAQSGLTVEWRKWNDLPDADVLVEGIIPAGKKMGMTSIVVSVVQYGLYVSLSDVFMLHAVDDGVVGATERVGNSCVRTMQKVIRTVLLAGTNKAFARTYNPATKVFSDPPTTRTGLGEAATATNRINAFDVALMQTLLITGNAETFDDGNFVCIAHPHVIHDLMVSSEWKEDHRYTDSEKIYQGEVGLYSGIRFISTDLAPIVKGTPMSAGAHTLTVKTAIASSATEIVVKEALTTADINALKGKKVRIGTTEYTLDSTGGTAGDAGEAKIKLGAAIDTLAANLTIYFSDNAIDGTAVYPTFFFGKNAFAAVEPEGANLRTIIKTPAQIGGALEQFGTVGAKFESAAAILYPTQIVTLEVTSSFSGTSVAN